MILQRKSNKAKKKLISSWHESWAKSLAERASKAATTSNDLSLVFPPDHVALAIDFTDSDSDDCEIIEQETPLIEIDDEASLDSSSSSEGEQIVEETTENLDTKPKTPEPPKLSEIGDTVLGDSNLPTVTEVIVNGTSGDIDLSPKTPEPLFFVDRNPATDIELVAPIYDIKSIPSTNLGTNTDQNMAQNFRITVRNKENDANLDNSFVPPHSSTRLNISCSDIVESTCSSSDNDTAPLAPTNFHISINSTGENETARQVFVGNTSPIASEARAINGNGNGGAKSDDGNKNNNNNGRRPGSGRASPIVFDLVGDNGNGNSYSVKQSNNNGIKGNSNSNNKNAPPKAIKRKADNVVQQAPPTKRNTSESSDVIILNDTITDEEDSVVFVSETLDHQNRHRVALARGNAAHGRAGDFISLRNTNANHKTNSVC